MSNIRGRVERLEKRHAEHTDAWVEITARRIEKTLADPTVAQEYKDRILHYLDLARARKAGQAPGPDEVSAARVLAEVVPEKAEMIDRMIEDAKHDKGT